MNNLEYILSVDPHAQTKQFKKGEVVQRPGDYKAATYYVRNGLLRSYIIDSKGKEHIFMFAPEEWIVADVESIEFNTPVELYVDCLEDSEVIIFDKDCFFKGDLTKEEIHKNTQLLYRRMGVLQRRVLMLMSAPAMDRYTYFLETYPNVPHRVPQHMIATYLGITPQALSTLRGKIARNS